LCYFKELSLTFEQLLVLTNIRFFVIIALMALIFSGFPDNPAYETKKKCLEKCEREPRLSESFSAAGNDRHLTGVSNRNCVSKIATNPANCRVGAFSMLDVADLKIVNDIYGQAAGERIFPLRLDLSRVANSPRTLPRVGGDDLSFYANISTSANPDVAQNLLKDLNSPFTFGEVKICPPAASGLPSPPHTALHTPNSTKNPTLHFTE
jgi:predicted signal transduction protein with EAL and GGDEF domain